MMNTEQNSDHSSHETIFEVYPGHETWSDHNLPTQEDFDIHHDCFGFEDSFHEYDYDDDNPYAGYEPDLFEDDYDDIDEFDLLSAQWVQNTVATLDYISDNFFSRGKGKRIRAGSITPSSLIYLQ